MEYGAGLNQAVAKSSCGVLIFKHLGEAYHFFSSVGQTADKQQERGNSVFI